MKNVRLSLVEWTVLVALALIVAGCGGREGNQPGSKGFHGPGDALIHVSLVATAVAGSLLIACGFLAFFLKGQSALVARIASGCVLVIASAQVVYWLGTHIWVAVAGIVVVGALWAWSHIKLVEKWVGKDLNADGKIG